ncbi:beta-propeller fold lactonase family protein [Mycobacterium sp. CVI_P3]|uniref:Beta-propeller fold lactonase family protein n=1 Tax=Mycobacterium pinniadriaticum TaxID=2994102 RepID=A0ABT3SEB4_9MYCO|nr:beta-propeller fold lactonase family protein [Mycobacterium pinniadriaticum]MCX2930783.1 beta-propeller fold lactonase family protein [Mycobacterium pinniadriaticum]MCX2937207.1 beta-propeller fold lactonase family protein [Mycobacterium pinniadriaticum]
MPNGPDVAEAATPAAAADSTKTATPAASAAALAIPTPTALLSGLTTLFGPLTNPLVPRPGEPMLLTVLSWAGREIEAALTRTRRQITMALFNEAPTASPLMFGEDAQGVVTGTIGAADAENDPVRYTVVGEPEHGTVVINADGTYTYTPTEEQAAQGGTDTFRVRVSDIGNHLHLFHGDGTTTVEVTVTVGAGEAMSVGALPVAAVASADGKRLYVVDADSNSVKIYDATTNTPLGAVPVGAFPYSITLSPDGKRAYVVNSDDNTISIIDTATLATIGGPIAVGNSPTNVAVSPNGTRLYVTNSNDDTVTVIHTSSGNTTDVIPVGASPYGVAVSSSGERLYVTNECDDSVSVINLATNKVIDTIAVGDAPTAIAINPTTGLAYITNTGSLATDGDGTVTVLDTATNTVVGDPIAVGEFPIGLAFSADSKLLFVANRGYDSVAVIDTSTNTLADTDPTTANAIDNLGVGDGPSALAVTGTTLFSLHTWDGTLLPVPILDWTGSPITGLASAPTTELVTLNTTSTATGGTATAKASATANDSTDYEPNSDLGSTGFDVYNNSSASLILTGWAGGDRPQQGAPEIGHVLNPGESDHFEVNTNFTDQEEVQPIYTSQATGETFTAQLYGATTGIVGGGDIPTAGCAHAGGTGTCSSGGTAVYFLDGSDSEQDSSYGSQGFDVYNLTQSTLTFLGFASADRPQFGGPTVGSTLLPGQSAHFEVNVDFFESEDVQVQYSAPSGEIWTASLATTPLSTSGLPTVTQCSQSGGTGSCNTGANSVQFVDAANTKITISASDPTAQMFVNTCNSSAVQCKFDAYAGGPVQGYTDPQYNTTVRNSTDVSLSETITLTNTATTTWNVSVSAKLSVKLFSAITAELSATYGLTTTETQTTTTQQAITVNPQEAVAVYTQYPTLSVTGDLIMNLGNTEVTMTNTTFVIPDPGDPNDGGTGRSAIVGLTNVPLDWVPGDPLPTDNSTDGSALA